MDFFSACGTWEGRHPAYGRIMAYIRSCEIFPNVSMIMEATGVSKQRAEDAVSSILMQESFYIARSFLLAKAGETPVTGMTQRQLLIYSYLEREEEGRDFTSLPVIRSFMDRHRFYDDDGVIRYRFSEEQVKDAVDAYQRYSKQESNDSPVSRE